MKGKKTAPETIYAIMAIWAITDNYAETARRLNLPESTVEHIVKENQDKEEFVELCAKKRSEFSKKASRIIDKAMDRLEKDIDNPKKRIPVNHLTTAIGTLYDKKMTDEGKIPAGSVFVVAGEKIDKLAELAGYAKQD